MLLAQNEIFIQEKDFIDDAISKNNKIVIFFFYLEFGWEYWSQYYKYIRNLKEQNKAKKQTKYMYSEVKDNVSKSVEYKFRKTSLNYQEEFNKAYFYTLNNPEIRRSSELSNAIILILEAVLSSYYRSTPKSKGGKFGRIAAKIFSAILPIFKILKWNK